MINESEKTEENIKRTIIYNLIIFSILLFWYYYSTFDNIIGLSLICFSSLFLIIYSFIFNSKISDKKSVKILHILLILIPITFLIDIFFFYEAYNPPIFLHFHILIGINHNHNLILFLVYFAIVILKLIPIKFFYKKIIKLFEERKLDNTIEYFLDDYSFKKIFLLIMLLPLVAFIEEFVFRSLLLSILVYYFRWDLIITILFISFVFGISHYSTSKNWGHFLSTTLSSIIYFLALIQLGLLYPWLLHLSTNIFAILFFYQNKKKEENRKNLIINDKDT